MAAPLLTGRRRVRQQLVGVLFLAVLASLVGLTVALYQKTFTEVTTVTLQADRAGNQLTQGADVKARGVLVGEVRDIESTGNGAKLELALDPDEAQRIPADTRVQLVPKTLFGEKYVSLVFDDTSPADPLSEGDVITQDRSETARETSQALDDFLPLLRALRPQDLSVTLNAVSGALRGRGNRLGENFELTDTYLRGFNPALPDLQENFRGLADFADTLDRTSPEFLALLDNVSEISRNLVDTEQQLNTFLTSTATSNDEFADFLNDNDDRLIALAADSRPVLGVYEKYAPEYPCFARALSVQKDLIAQTFGGLQPGLHITLEFTENQGGYRPEDKPAYGEDDGPTCRGLPPNEPIVPFPVDMEVTDGYCDEQEEREPGVQTECRRAEDEERDSPVADPARALAPRELDRAAVGAVAGPVLGVSPRDVPDLAVLLFGPVARGTAVGLTDQQPR